MEKDARQRISGCAERDAQQQQLEERPAATEQIPDDYAQWLDQRRFDDDEEQDQ